jgi:hypothetical protein
LDELSWDQKLRWARKEENWFSLQPINIYSVGKLSETTASTLMLQNLQHGGKEGTALEADDPVCIGV